MTVSALRRRFFTQIRPQAPLRLVDLMGPGLARRGADARLTTGGYRVAQRWALALFQHPERPDGLYYRARHDPARECAAIFDRAAPLLVTAGQICLADPSHANLLAGLLDAYGFGLLDDSAS